jgi:hypothetical protein
VSQAFERRCSCTLKAATYPAVAAWPCAKQVGTWLSLVERTLGVGEVASSNLVVPTIIPQELSFFRISSWVHPWVQMGPSPFSSC